MNLRRRMAELGNSQKEYRYAYVLPFDFNGKIANRVVDARNSLLELNTKKVKFKNRDYYFATGRIIGDLNITMLEDENHQSLEWLEGWQGKIINRDETVNPPFTYMAPIVKIELGRNGEEGAKFTYLCFPAKPGDQFSKDEGGGITKLNINFKVVNYFRE